jgi:CTP:molybdopterin cytidylyltransferase MocA/SAM-dependent methyltransferase
MTKETVGLVLAAGAGTRFGGGKLLATIAGRPVLQHVLDALRAAGVEDSVVVLGGDADQIEGAIEWGSERRVVNPDPERGLASSLQVGFEAIGPDAGAVLVALGDQPLVSAGVIRALLDAPAKRGRSIVVPVYPDDRGRNPVLVRRAAFALVGEATGDRGLGPLIEAHKDLVQEIPVDAANPDIDTHADLAGAIEASWGARVRANREQVVRLGVVPDGSYFYAPVSSLFRADPTRTDDPVLDALLALVRSGETWLDVGAGAGRFALPIARALDPSGGSVIALDPSRSMLEGLLEIAEDYAVENVRTIEARWPLSDARAVADFEADVTLIAHVGYDVEEIGPFVDALEAAAERLCVAVLMEQAPAAAANPFWPPVHGEERVPLPALPDLLELLEARGRHPSVDRIAIEPRRFESREVLEGFVRRQLWIDPAGPKEKRFQKALGPLAVETPDGWTLAGRGAGSVGIVTWSPR